MKEHKFPYKWYLKEGYPEKNGLKVFSCFAGGGGSTMGYKLAGYEVLGANEIDPKMAECYKVNHDPKYLFIEPIQEFKLRNNLPEELYDLDILDGSPPCSSFSMTGNREKDWGKEKKFREGQQKQILDTLFFDFIDLGKKLQPKMIVIENVKGLLIGNAKKYVKRIYKELNAGGYYVRKFLLNSSTMGVPQRRERVFFISLRKDLAWKIDPDLMAFGLFTPLNYLDMVFDEHKILFSNISDDDDISVKENTKISEYWDKVAPGRDFSTKHPTGLFFNDSKSHPYKVLADPQHGSWHFNIKRLLNNKEIISAGTFPIDYDFNTANFKYIIGMSVPPIMIAQIATKLKDQIFDKLGD